MLFLSMPTLESLDTLDRKTELVGLAFTGFSCPLKAYLKKTVESTANHIAF